MENTSQDQEDLEHAETVQDQSHTMIIYYHVLIMMDMLKLKMTLIQMDTQSKSVYGLVVDQDMFIQHMDVRIEHMFFEINLN